MKKYLLLICFSFAFIFCVGQDITRNEADSMLKALDKSKNIERIDLLLNLAQFHIFKPGENQIDFDSAQVLIQEAAELNRSIKSISAQGYQLLTESYLTKEKGKKEEGKKMVEEAISILESHDSKSYLGRAYFELSNYYDYRDPDEFSKKIALVNKSLDAFQKEGELKYKARSLEMLGDLYIRNGNDSVGIKTLKQALEVYDAINYPKVQGVYTLIGESQMERNDFGQALSNLLKALKTTYSVNDSSMRLCQINNILGSLYSRIDRKDLSIKYKKEALGVAMKYQDQAAIFLVALSTAADHTNLNQPQEALKVLEFIPKTYIASLDTLRQAHLAITYVRIYLVLKKYDSVQSYVNSILQLANGKMIDFRTKMAIYRMAALHCFYTQQYPKAQYYLTKNLEILKKTPSLTAQIDDAKLWYKLDSAQGHFRSAYNHLSFFKTKTDSILSQNKIRQLQVLGVEYETAAKEDSINLKNKDIVLLKQKNALQQANLKHASLTKNVTFAGIVLSFIIIGLLYRQYRHKQKTNKVITLKNEQLQHFLTEKEWLLKEIHHRVKNNLQIVMSLLNSQSAFIDNEPALTAIHDSQHRVHAMSLIHQKLYNTENLSSIDMSVYIRELATYLRDSFDIGQRIRFEFNIQPIEMDVSQAVPLGLILNEAITNSLKYAFPDDRSGVISISLSNVSTNQYLLSIADNGVGISADLKKTGSLGMSLMKGLSEDLDGNFSIENNSGTSIKILFIYEYSVRKQGLLAESFVTNN
ncbi:MAG TPA: sensor histidine kinase [Chitinophagaceae bacterium]|nr:sensor histidine kinase [Chitinophagaceae bacterium]